LAAGQARFPHRVSGGPASACPELDHRAAFAPPRFQRFADTCEKLDP
jgi:hypothetical protein